MSQSPDPKYTLCSDSPTQNTHIHMHTLFGPYIAYWDACVPLVACKASSCSTYTHSFPLPTPISSPLNGPWGPELSLGLSRTFSSSCFPVWIPLIYLWISPSLASSRIDHPIFAHRLLSLYLKLVPPGEGRKRKEAVLTQQSETSPFQFHYKQAMQGVSEEGGSERKMKIQRSSKTCNLVNNPKRSTA